MYIFFLFIILKEAHVTLQNEIDPSNEIYFPRKVTFGNKVQSNLNQDYVNNLDIYVHHIVMRGQQSLTVTGKTIIKYIDSGKQATIEETSLVIKNYIMQIQKYYRYIMKTYADSPKRFTKQEDEEFLLRNILETAINCFYYSQHHLLSNVAKKINTTAQDVIKIQQIENILLKQYENEKRREIQYLCTEYELCKPYPSFTDYLESFIIEVLKLPDDKLRTLMNLLREIAINNNNFYVLTDSLHGRLTIIDEMENLCGNKTIRLCLNLVKSVINQRFKILDSPNWKLVVRVQAARILFDMLDKTFHYSRDANFVLDYETAVDAIKDWNRYGTILPTAIIELLINNVLRIATLSETSMKGGLIDIIVSGNTNYVGLNESTFQRGYKGVYANLKSIHRRRRLL